MNPRLVATASLLATLAACASGQHTAQPTPTQSSQHAEAPRQTIYGGEFMVVGGANGSGDAYDATLLFERANASVRTHRCDAAIEDYDRLLNQFPTSPLVPSTHYNRGVCLQSMSRADEAIADFREAAAHGTSRDLVRDAYFRIAVVGESTQRVPIVLEATDALLAIQDLSIPDRVEALARRAAALLARGDFTAASAAAHDAINVAPTAEAISALGDDEYAAEARFVLADATRQQAAAIHVDADSPTLENTISRRVTLVIHAHVQFNDTIRVGNPHWMAASGYSIGQMYRALYDAIVFAHTPADWEPSVVERYRTESGRRLRPLLQGALRAWEATLDMADHAGIGDNDWVRRAQRDVGELRDLVVNGRVPSNASDASGEASSSSPPPANDVATSSSSPPPSSSDAPATTASATSSSAPPSGETEASNDPVPTSRHGRHRGHASP